MQNTDTQVTFKREKFNYLNESIVYENKVIDDNVTYQNKIW